MKFEMIWSIWTVVVVVIFVAIFIWAWSSKRKKEFDEAAHIPLNEDEPLTKDSRREKNDG